MKPSGKDNADAKIKHPIKELRD
jgi:hypothetical protein